MQIKDLISKSVGDDSDFLIMQSNSTGETYKITKADLLQGLSSGGTGGTEIKLIGTPFGASPSYSVGSEFDKAFDGNLTTSYDYLYPSGGYAGLDLGINNNKILTKVRVFPRQDSGVHYRSGGAIIQGSNSSEISGYVNLFTFPSTPNTNTWYEGNISVSTAYRYLRYYAVDGAYCSVAEIEFYGV